jgi:hypothetical protein
VMATAVSNRATESWEARVQPEPGPNQCECNCN